MIDAKSCETWPVMMEKPTTLFTLEVRHSYPQYHKGTFTEMTCESFRHSEKHNNNKRLVGVEIDGVPQYEELYILCQAKITT